MSHATPTGEVHQLVLVPLMRDAWRLCDRTVASSNADNLIAYVELIEDEAYEVVWVVSGAGVETFTRLEDILRAAFERLSRADEQRRCVPPGSRSYPIPSRTCRPRALADSSCCRAEQKIERGHAVGATSPNECRRVVGCWRHGHHGVGSLSGDGGGRGLAVGGTREGRAGVVAGSAETPARATSSVSSRPTPRRRWRDGWERSAAARSCSSSGSTPSEQIARWQGIQTGILADALDLALLDGASRPDTTQSVRSLAAELACAVGMADRTLEAHMNDAQVLRDRFARTFTALREGRLSRAHAQVIADEGIRLGDDDVRSEYETLVLEIVPHLTTGRLRVAAAAIAEQLHPVPLAERHADARALRRVTVRDAGDGMAELWALLPAPLAHAHPRPADPFRSHRNRRCSAPLAPAPAEADRPDESPVTDDRTMDQRRADILCDVLLTGHSTTAEIDRDGGAGIDAIRGIVQITVPLPVLAGDDGGAVATLTGRGTARSGLRPTPRRQRHHLGPSPHRSRDGPRRGSGSSLSHQTPAASSSRPRRALPLSRVPTTGVALRHRPHDRPPARRRDLHLQPRPPLPPPSHGEAPDRVAGSPDADGTLTWTSPLGRIYTDETPPTLRFIPGRQ